MMYRSIPYRQNYDFYGRERELELLQTALAPRDGEVVSYGLYGIGGIGKTQIATEFVHRNVSNYDAVFWVNATTQTSIAQTFDDIAVNDLQLSGAHSQNHRRNRALVLQWLSETSTILMARGTANADYNI